VRETSNGESKQPARYKEVAMFYFLALLVAAVAGDTPRVSKPWHLIVVVEREAQSHLLIADYVHEDDCREDLLAIVYAETINAVVTAASCDRDPYEV
jgi:hypothetical protein